MSVNILKNTTIFEKKIEYILIDIKR